MNDGTPFDPDANLEADGSDGGTTLDAYLDGELTPAARSAFESALASDPALAATLEAQVALDATLRAALRPLAAGDAAIAERVLATAEVALPPDGSARSTPPSLPRPTHPWIAALALAASLLLIVRLGPSPDSPVVPSLGEWRVANDRGLVVWIPEGVPKKVPVETPTTFETDGELVTLDDRGVALTTPAGRSALIAPNSMASLDAGELVLLHGSIWLESRRRAEETASVWLGQRPSIASGNGAIEVRGSGSFSVEGENGLVTVRARRGAVSIFEGGVETRRFESGLLVLGGKSSEVEKDREGWLAFGWAAPLLDRGATLDALLEAHIAALASEKVSDRARRQLTAHFGRAAVSPLRDELLDFRKEPADSPRRLNAARALRGIIERGALGADSARPDLRAQKLIDSLFSLPLAVAETSGTKRPPSETKVLEEVLRALATATGVGPIPDLDAWLEKDIRDRRKDFLEKWHAVWQHRVKVHRE